MRFFSTAYDKALVWAAHPHAPRYLAGLSFAESSFFPIPPDVMLAPMALASPARAWHFAALTTLASAVGGAFGYVIGMFAFELVAPLLHSAGYWDSYEKVTAWFATWGFWAIFIAGFSPIPYKVFTISAGAVSMPFLPFLLASLCGRGARFFLVAAIMVWGGPRMEPLLRKHIDRLGWITLVGALILYLVLRE